MRLLLPKSGACLPKLANRSARGPKLSLCRKPYIEGADHRGDRVGQEDHQAREAGEPRDEDVEHQGDRERDRHLQGMSTSENREDEPHAARGTTGR